jgi:CheY-like chemotaxis protein
MSTILVAEDDGSSAALICAVMAKAGHHTLTAADGPGVLESARSSTPDLMLLDVSLDGPMTGLDVCRAVRADPALAHIPVIVLSGWAFSSDIEAGKDAGADAYLAKPFSPADLKLIVQGHLDQAARRTKPR